MTADLSKVTNPNDRKRRRVVIEADDVWLDGDDDWVFTTAKPNGDTRTFYIHTDAPELIRIEDIVEPYVPQWGDLAQASDGQRVIVIHPADGEGDVRVSAESGNVFWYHPTELTLISRGPSDVDS